MENKLEMDIENVVIEGVHQIGKKNKNRSRPVVAQFSFYKGKMNILKNCKNLKTQYFPSLRIFVERQLPSARKMARSSCQ